MGVKEAGSVQGGAPLQGTVRIDEAAPVVRSDEPRSVQGTVPQKPVDPTRTAGAENVQPVIGKDGAPAARQIDLVRLTEQMGKGQLELRLHLTPGAKLAGAKIPEGTYAVVEVASTASGEVDFERSTLRFENAKGERVVLDREHSLFDVVGANVSDDGALNVDIAVSPFDVDVTEKLLGVKKLPQKVSELVALATDRAGAKQPGKAGIIDKKDVSYSGFFVAKQGVLPLAGRSSVELLADANVFIKGNSAAGMLQLNGAENGARLDLESVDGNVFRSGPSTLNLRVGYKADDNARFFMFHDSQLNDVALTVNLGEKPITVNVGKLELDGHDQGSAVPDARFAALVTDAKARGISVPPSEVAGPDIEMVVVKKFIEQWPLSDIAESKAERMAQLLKDPQGTEIPGLLGLFRGSIVEGVQEGLDRVPYFIREKLQAMPTEELAIVVQRALVADLARRYGAIPASAGESSEEQRKDWAERSYHAEVKELVGMLRAQIGRETDTAEKKGYTELLERLTDPATGKVVRRDIDKDVAVLKGSREDLRPSPELPPYDAFAYLFERDGTLDKNLRDHIMPALLEKLEGRLPESGQVTVKELALKPGIEPMAFLALHHPKVQEAMRDPKVRALASQARKSVEKLVEGFTLMRLEDTDLATQRKVLATVLAEKNGTTPDKVPAAEIDAILAEPKTSMGLYAMLAANGRATFEAGKAELREMFVAAGGMEPNGRAEGFLNQVIDEVIKADVLPKDKAAELDKNRQKLISMAVNTARAAIAIRLNPNYRDWSKVAEELLPKVAQDDARRTQNGSEAWCKELEALTGAELDGGNEVRSFTSGPEFYETLRAEIQSAPPGSHIVANYWGIYDDESGRGFVDDLIAKHRQGYPVTVIVDGQTHLNTGIGKEVLQKLREAGVPLVDWVDPENPPFGNHIKYALVAKPRSGGQHDLTVLFGGSNVGAAYTHVGESETKWSDTNAMMRGPAAAQYLTLTRNLLAQAGASATLPEVKSVAPTSGQARVAVLHDEPADFQNPILLATMKMLEGSKAGESVRIKNAYFVMTEPIRATLARALERGVNVEIFTNSPMSVDEPAVAIPILDSAREALRMSERLQGRAGAGKVRVFVPKVDLAHPEASDRNTVHDKVTLAGNVTAIMTYNMHPRSETLENEAATIIVDEATARTQLERWRASLATATELDSSAHPLFAANKLDYKSVALEVFKNLF